MSILIFGRTKKFHWLVTFFTVLYNWRKAKAMTDLIKGVLLATKPIRRYQLFELPTRGCNLQITSREQEFRDENRLCPDCRNHAAGDGGPCIQNPLYKDIQCDDGA